MELVAKKHDFTVFNIIFWLIVLMFAFMCLHGSKVFAVDISFTYDNENVTLTNVDVPYNDYAVFCYRSDVSHNIVSYVCSWDNSSSYFHYKFDDRSSSFQAHNLDHSSTNLPFYCAMPSSTVRDWSEVSFESTGSRSFGYVLYPAFTTTDIYDATVGNYDTVVFQAPPQQVEALGIIAEKTQGVEMNKVLQETTGILPTLLVILVGAIAIRKAIQFLIQQMKRQ